MISQLQVAVVGCGRMGRVRAQAASDLGANVRFVCDENLDRAQELAARFDGCKALVNSEQLEWNQLDAIFICTPPSERGKVELPAIEHGVAFLVEKPAGISSRSVSAITTALASKPTLTAVGYMNRYRRSVQTLKKETSGKTILGMSADWLVGMYDVPWWAEISGSGGPVNEQATHLVDLARYLVGEISHVQAITQPISDKPELIGTAAINLKFESGPSCSMLYSCQAKEKMIRLHVYMDDRDMVLSGWDFHLEGDDSTAVEYEKRNEIFWTETSVFLESIQSGNSAAILSTFEDAVRTQLVLDAIHRAADSGNREAVAT